MTYFTSVIFKTLLFIDSDSTPRPLNQTAKHMEIQLMEKAISPLLRDRLHGSLDNNSEATEDPCSWKREIKCTENVLTDLFPRSEYINLQMVVSLELLPPTIQFIHMDLIFITKVIEADKLPRDLRYLSLHNCFPNDTKGNVDFQRLPSKMEELIISCPGTVMAGRILCFNALPRTMRLVFIKQQEILIDKILVDYDGLPASLRQLCISGAIRDERKQLLHKCREIGRPNHVRLEIGGETLSPVGKSKYAYHFEHEAMRMRELYVQSE